MRPAVIARWQNLLFSALLTSLCLAFGWLSQQHYLQWDLSGSQHNSLSPSSIAVVKLLEAPVDILAIVGPDKAIRETIQKLFDKYQQYNDKLQLLFLNPELNPTEAKKLNAADGGELILSYNDHQQRIRHLSERAITTALQRLARPATRNVGFIHGHGERQFTDKSNQSYSILRDKLEETGFKFSHLNLILQPTIPSTIDLLVIAAPTARYFPGEVASILNYLSTGGNVIWLLEPGFRDTGLKAIATDIGVDALPGIIIDTTARNFNLDSPTFVLINEYYPHSLTMELAGVTLFPEASGLSILPKQEHTIHPILRTNKNSWTETGAIEGEVGFDPAENEVAGPITLAATIERDKKGRQQRIVVIGDADFMANGWIGNGSNLELTNRLFNWLTVDDNMIEFTSNNTNSQQLTLSNQQSIIFALCFLLLIPVLLLSIGFVVWRRFRQA